MNIKDRLKKFEEGPSNPKVAKLYNQLHLLEQIAFLINQYQNIYGYEGDYGLSTKIRIDEVEGQIKELLGEYEEQD